MKLPAKTEIQIIDDTGRSKPLANVLFGLKIFIDAGSWHNYSFFKTDSKGHICLTKQQIIDNTELRWGDYIESDAPTKFELYVWDGDYVSDLIGTIKRILSIYEDEALLKKDLLVRGVGEENLPDAIRATMEKSREDLALFELLKDAVNKNIDVAIPKIEGVWFDSLPKQYQFVVRLRD